MDEATEEEEFASSGGGSGEGVTITWKGGRGRRGGGRNAVFGGENGGL